MWFNLLLTIACVLLSLTFPLNTINASFTRYGFNPIISPRTGYWDSQYVLNPAVIKRESEYKLWHDGNSGSGWRIGLASSADGVSSWVRSLSAVIDVGSSNGWETETATPTVIYNDDLGKYQMWYTSINSLYWISGHDRFRLKYAISDDGINWDEYNGWVLTGSLGQWDSGGIARGISVIYLNGTYHLWYSATNDNDLTVNPYWRIGYATSPDGIHWTKQNGGNPVIEPTTLWELNNISYPHVIVDSGMFKIWYAASQADLPTKFVYAYSIDGINWTKPSDQNPVFTLGMIGSFDSVYISQPFVLRDGSQYKMWYSGFNGSRWAIGYATATAPSPSPSPSPTSTPTPIPVTKVVVIPGTMASNNTYKLLNCEPVGDSEDWTMMDSAAQYLEPLYEHLGRSGFTVLPFYYDWRNTPYRNAAYLNEFINAHTVPNEKVYVLGHSQGGLVARAYLEQVQNESKIDSLLTVGTPHEGLHEAYTVWEGAEIPEWGQNDLRLRLLKFYVMSLCSSVHGISPVEAVRSYTPVFAYMLPTFDYLRDQKTNTLIPTFSLDHQNPWLPNNNFHYPFFGTRVGTLAGTGQKTPLELTVKPATNKEYLLGLWDDGSPTKKAWNTDGDETVLKSSAQLSGAENLEAVTSHNGLISTQLGLDKISEFFGSGFVFPSLAALTSFEPTSALVVLTDSGKLFLETPSGAKHQDRSGVVAIMNPAEGAYKLTFVPTQDENGRFFVVQLLPNGKDLWKEYRYLGTRIQEKLILYSPRGSTPDIVQ